MALALVAFHGGNEQTQISAGHIGQRMGPVFEHASVDALRLAQIRAAIGGNPVPQNMVVAALDHINGVDLHIAEMLDGSRSRGWSVAARRFSVEPLRAASDTPRRSIGHGV